MKKRILMMLFPIFTSCSEIETGIIVTQKINIIYQNGDTETVYRRFDSSKYSKWRTVDRHPSLYKGCVYVVDRCGVRSFTESETNK